MNNEEEPHLMQKWFSIGDLISAAVMLVGLGAVWGNLSKDVQGLQREVSDLKTMTRGMTPGAAEALATIRAKDASQDQQLMELRQELRESRAEILSEVRMIRTELNEHDRGK